MFEDLMRELKKMEREPVRISIEADEDGYFDRECPNEECEFQFKVMLDNWEDGFEGQYMHCPLCGTMASADHFWTKEHLDQMGRQATNYYAGRIGKAMSRDARKFNSRQSRKSFISMSLEYKGSTHVPALVPVEAAEEMRLKIVCEECKERFAVIGSAFFCPKCGHSSAVRMFKDALAKIEAKVEHLDRVVQAVAEVDKDAAELTRRSLLESGILDAVVAFQRVMEELYRVHPNAVKKIRQNAFQRLDDGSKLWQSAGQQTYCEILSESELGRLKGYFQRRHLLAHKEGIVDQHYLERSEESTYALGQRIVVRPEHVAELVALVRKLVTAYLPEGEAS